MKTKTLLAVLSVSAFSLQPLALFAQGSLTPPGAPGATMKTLAQIEPRTPITSAPFTISSSGSYYLTTNLTVSSGDAITISAGNVTLDLNGFTIAGTAAVATGYAIALGTVTNVAIYNGHISSGVTNSAAGVFGGGGFAYGIANSGTVPSNVRVKAVSVAGVLDDGIALGTANSTVMEACAVNVAGSEGIVADSVADSTAQNCGNLGIYAGTAENCTGSGVGYGTGLEANTANNCHGTSSRNGDGLFANTANNCYGFSSGSGYGLFASAVASGCYGSSSSGTGVWGFNVQNCWGITGGTSAGTFGVYANDIATGSYGTCGAGGVGLRAYIANSCDGSSLSVTYKYNMP